MNKSNAKIRLEELEMADFNEKEDIRYLQDQSSDEGGRGSQIKIKIPRSLKQNIKSIKFDA